MKRRDFISKAGLAGVGSAATVAAASSFPKPALAQECIEMVIVSTWGRFPVWEPTPSSWRRSWRCLRRSYSGSVFLGRRTCRRI